MTTIADIEGIGPAYAEKLREAGVRSVAALLEQCGTAKGRKELSSVTDIPESKLLEWTNHADLYRVRGVGSEYADLLEEAGVDTIPELAHRKPELLYQTLIKVNQANKLVRKLPTEDQVKAWVKQAKSLPRVVKY